jgi:hypothetical protein
VTKARAIAAVAIVLPVLFTGCSRSDADQPGDSSRPGAIVTQTVGSPLTISGTEVSPILEADELSAATGLGPENAEVVQRAFTELSNQCLKAAGFETLLAYPAAATGPAPTGYPTEQQLLLSGYGWNEPSPVTVDTGISENAQRLLDDSCGPSAAETLRLSAWNLAQQNLSDGAVQAINSVISDPSYTAALAVWDGCMATAGFSYPSPGSAKAAAQASFGGYTSESSIQQALIDYDCRAKASLLESRIALQNRAWRAWLEAHPGVLSEAQEATTVLLEKSKAVLDGQ